MKKSKVVDGPVSGIKILTAAEARKQTAARKKQLPQEYLEQLLSKVNDGIMLGNKFTEVAILMDKIMPVAIKKLHALGYKTITRKGKNFPPAISTTYSTPFEDNETILKISW